MFRPARSPIFFTQIIALLILLGIGFRVYGLGDRVYWVDEVATSIRISGYTKAQVTTELSDGLLRTPDQLQHFLHPVPDLAWSAVLGALVQSPEHAPLYFLLVHGWTKLWGSSVVAVRSLSVLCSIVAIALMYRLASRLFDSTQVGAIAAALFALSPFFVSYAQEARPYSLWSVMLLWSALTLLSAMRRPSNRRWLHYGLSVTLSLYTSLLSVLVLLGQGLYVVWQGDRKQQQGFGRSVALAGVAFLPWVAVGLYHWSRLQANTEWMHQSIGVLPLLVIWLYNTSILLFDVPATLSPDLVTAAKLLTSVLLVGLMAIALRTLQRHQPHVWSFVLLFACPIPAILLGLDIVRNSQLSTAARYLLPFHLGMILALSFFLTHLLNAKAVKRQVLGRSIALSLIALCCISYGFQLQQPPKYQKSRNLHNRSIAALINQTTTPRLISEPINAIDLISLSLDLQPKTQIQVTATDKNSSRINLGLQPCEPVFLLNPSIELKAEIQKIQAPIREVYQPQKLVSSELALSLWQVDRQCLNQ